jgi:hypothetical protein
MRKIEEKRKGADRQLRLSTIYAQGRRQPARAPTRRIFVLRTNYHGNPVSVALWDVWLQAKDPFQA